MRSIVGLGNPGKRYDFTRHNVGFQILDQFAKRNKIKFKASKRDYFYSEGLLRSSDFFLIKPSTYMNLSGVAVLDFVSEYSIDLEDLLIVYDDVNLQPGQIRLRRSGSDGGHNGIKSIIYHLQNDSFSRLRFGIGSEFEKGDMAEFVLDKFSSNEMKLVDESMVFAVELIERFIAGGYKSMLDHFSKQLKDKNNAENLNITGN
ncbi:MAG: aminoacyl-tRNA hydrolase [Ignavibacteriales bacterium]|nr:MAG: aminoacyl-tRNA hydrolase [Ignavibacteriales bacterium]